MFPSHDRTSSEKRRAALEAFRKEAMKVRNDVAATQVSAESFIQPIGNAFGAKPLISAESLKKIAEEQEKGNKKTNEWKEKLKKANEELRKSNQLVQMLQKAQDNLVQSATFGGTVDSLAKLTTQAAGAQRGTGEREGLNRLLTAGFNKFQQFDPMSLSGQGQQKIEITIAADEAGIITPVVKSQQLNDQVVTIVTKTVNQQARTNDR